MGSDYKLEKQEILDYLTWNKFKADHDQSDIYQTLHFWGCDLGCCICLTLKILP